MDKNLGNSIIELHSKGYSRKQIIEELNCSKSIVSCQARKLLEESGREQKCAICGFSEYVEACHIKAISSFPLDTKIKDVNNLDNLVYLCPNHHILFDRNKLSKEDISHIMSLA